METKPDLPAVECAYATDSGRHPDKQVNEDACAYETTPSGHLAVLCDGMGGHQNGREASELAVKIVVETLVNAPPPADVARGVRCRELLKEAIALANAKVFALGAGSSKQARPGSTVVAILMHRDGVEVAHVGDSRCYLVQGDQIFQVTRDHTVVQQLVDNEVLSPAQAAVHPDANQILRALGAAPEVEVEVRAQTIPLATGEAFVLCSDGLSDLVLAPEVLGVVNAAPPAEAARALVELANARGGHDNVTVLILRNREGAREGARESGRALRDSAPKVAQTLFEAPLAPMLQPATRDQGEAVAVATESGAPLAASAPGSPTLPMISLPVAAPPPPRPRGFPVAVAFGVLLAVVGFGAAGFALFLVLNPNHNQKNVAPFAVAGSPLAAHPSSQGLVPMPPEAPPSPADAGLDAGPSSAPLPSLVPPKPLRRGHTP
jgi:serine/threonine protein phosphatase PrpC